MRRSARGLLAAALLAASGCAAPPDVAPFADSTAALRSAVRASGEALDATVRTSGLAGASGHADRLRAAWSKRVGVMDAAVSYAEALREVVGSAASSADTVREVAGAVQSIADAAGFAMPAPAAVSVATDGAAFVFRQIANARAAKTLEESLAASDSAIQEIASLLAADRKDVDDLLAIVESDAVSRIETSDAHRNVPVELTRIEEAVLRITSRIDAATPDDLVRLEALTARGDSLRARLAARDAEVAAVRSRRRDQSDLVAAYGEALSAWAAAHGQLVRAVRERRPVSPASLIEATTEMRVLVRKVRAL